MHSEPIEQYLESLAAGGPGGPGGRVGAALHAAALHAALGAALVARVARAGGGSAAEHAAARAADDLRATALRLTVGPGADPVAAARGAVRVIEVAERALGLAETLRPVGDRATSGSAARTLLTDVAAAAEALRAAVGAARVDVEVDLGSITDPGVREELLLALDPVDDVVLRAAKVTAVVREQIVR